MQQQIKSRQRVTEHGEVFTAEREVKAMCDLVKQETERIDSRFLDKTTPRLIQFHTFKNAVNPPFLGGFSIFSTVAAWAERHPCQGESPSSVVLCNDRKAIVTE